MKHIDRNPDVDLDREEIPPGHQLIRGKNLMHSARSKGIPFGVASETVPANYQRKAARRETVGLVIRDGDVARLQSALAVRGKYQPVATRRDS